VKNKHYDVVKLLLKSKALIDFGPANGQTALGQAICNNDSRMVGILIRTKANIHKTDSLKSSPLFCACQGQSVDIVRILLISKADPNQNKKMSPIKVACYQGGADIRIVNLLLEFKASIDPGVLSCAVIHSDVSIVRSLIDAAADVNIMDKGWTALHHACRTGSVEKVKLLLQARANPNISATFLSEEYLDDTPRSAIGTALRSKHYEVVEELLRRGADHGQIFDNFTPSQVSSDQRLVDILKNVGIGE
jgi:ankyrin repeat protein